MYFLLILSCGTKVSVCILSCRVWHWTVLRSRCLECLSMVRPMWLSHVRAVSKDSGSWILTPKVCVHTPMSSGSTPNWGERARWQQSWTNLEMKTRRIAAHTKDGKIPSSEIMWDTIGYTVLLIKHLPTHIKVLSRNCNQDLPKFGHV